MLRDRLEATSLSKEERSELVRHLAKFGRTPAVQAMLAEKLGDVQANAEIRQTVLRVMADV